MGAEAAALPRAEGIDFVDGKPFRKLLDHGGRAHVDRPLPFLTLNRFDDDAADSLARRVAATGSAYVIWPARAVCDGEARDIIGRIANGQAGQFDRVLLVSLYDLPRDQALDEAAARLERFAFKVSVSDDPAGQAAAARLEQALGKIEIDLRCPKVESLSEGYFEPGIEALTMAAPRVSHISLGLPQIYRVPGEDGIYPQLFHDLTIAVFDALLQGFHAFLTTTSDDAPPHHRALARRSFIAAARTADRKLATIAAEFDFLLSVSPINTEAALDQFDADRHEKAPVFRYRPLTIDPESTKRRLYAIDLRRVEDPVLESLFGEKRRELDQQLTMLQCRNTPDFRYSSLMLYGPVEPALLVAARAILDRVTPVGAADRDMIGAGAIRDAAKGLAARYREQSAEFDARISVREDIAAGLMVSGRRLLISSATRMRRARLDALLQHEMSIHLLTYINGNAQGLKIFRAGLADYEGVQEGLGVFAECAVGGLTAVRLRLLAARVVIVEAMIEGASFIDSFRILRDSHGYSARGAFNICARVYRSGGLAKDAIYLRGFQQVLDILAAGGDLTPFWFGKIAARHIPIVDELSMRGLLQPPRIVPEFLARPDAQARITFMRTNPALSELI